jgi:DnaA family protein
MPGHPAEQLILDLARPEAPTFANFVAGANREAVAALSSLANGTLPHPGLLVWGGPGGGKTHLLHAASAAARDAGRFVAEGIIAVDDVRPGMLVVVDDVHGLAPSAQAAFFTLVNALAAAGGQWLAASHVPPMRLPLRDDLRTRVALGLVLEIQPLADVDKPAALATYARERGFHLSDDVIVYLLAHGRRDMKSLVATLAALDRRSLAMKRNVTVPLLREWLQRDLGLTR